MMTYEYDPRSPKIKELGLFLAMTLPALPLFALSWGIGNVFAWLYRLTAVLLLTVGFGFASRYLMRRYVYRIELRDGVRLDAPPDFVVIEQIGKRVRTVCRVSVGDAVEITRLTHENCKTLIEDAKKKRCYVYTDRLPASNDTFLTVLDGEEYVCIRVLADEKLYFLLKNAIDSNKCLF